MTDPTADDVREALAQMFFYAEAPHAHWKAGHEGDAAEHLYQNAYSRADEALTLVRPHGTVTPPADDVREALAAEAWAAYQLEHGYSTVGVVPDVGADFWAGFERGYEARPRGTVTEEEAKMRKSFASIAKMAEWWHGAADKVLERLRMETTEDVMLYHDAVSVLVSAHSLFRVAELHTKGDPRG